MKKRLFLFFGGVLLAFAYAFGAVDVAIAAPAAPVDHVLTQPDGSTFIARQWGDEWLNGYETTSGYTILQEEDGWWAYAEKALDGSLVPVRVDEETLIVNLTEPEGLPKHVRPDHPEEEALLLGRSAIRSQNSGSHPTLVLLASFSNRAGTYSAANYASAVFGATNSVKDFYLTASHSLLTFAPATESHGTANDGVVGWLTLNYTHPNTGTSTGNANALIVKDVLNAANTYVNFANYDTNGNGSISIDELHIVVVVAGYERSYSNSSPSIWAHRWCLNNVGLPTLDGKVLGDYYANGGYAQIGEIHLDHPATIGIIAHELGHDISWPDLYDTDVSSEGVGEWSIMSSGNWNNTAGSYPGSSPALADAFLKYYQGWIRPTEVVGTLTSAAILQAATNDSAFLLRPNPGRVDWEFQQYSGTGEYFLVENRQLTSYDAGLPGCGLLIWHIDESVTSTNSANADENHPLVKLMEADGLNELYSGTDRGDAGDPFPGTTNKTTFNYSSTPNSRLYSGADSLVSVTGISSCAATMTATLTYNVAPSAPTGVAASDGAFADRVNVSWTAPTGATFYKVYRNTSNTHTAEIELTSSETNTTFNDTSATPGQTYYYWVIACNTAGCSGYSTHDTGYRAVTIPAAPTGVSASDGAYTDRVQVTWTASSGAVYYRVFQNITNNALTSIELPGPPPASPYDDTLVMQGWLYYYWVKACNVNGCSDYSASDTGYAALYSPPGLTASDGDYTDKVRITWDPSDGSDYYELYRNTSNTHTAESLLASGFINTYDDTTATPGQTYYYWVRACSYTTGCSDYSTSDSGYRALSPPTGVSASDGTYTDKVTISWTASTGATYYRVFQSVSDDATSAPELPGSPTTSLHDSFVAVPGQMYYYWAKACNATGCSDYSASDTGYRALSPPTGVSATDGTYTDKVTISWTASTGATYYRVFQSVSDDATSAPELPGSPTTSLHDSFVAVPGQLYYYWVKACNATGCSDYSASDTGYRALSPPTGVSASDDTFTDKVRVSWTASSGATSYEVYRHIISDPASATKLAGAPTGSTYDDTAATPGVTYYYWVKACSLAGCSGFSSSDTGRRADAIPAAPTGVTASDDTYADKVRVSWEDSSGATTYEVYRHTSSDSASATKLAGSPAGSPYNDTTATPGVTYYYWVKACSLAGCSGFSSSDTGRRADAIPAAPTGVTASDDTYADKVRVSWEDSSGATSYEVYRHTSSDSASATKLAGAPAGSPYDDTTATVGATFYYWVKACNSGGCSDFSLHDTGRRAPVAAPVSVSASDGTFSDKVRVTWTASANAIYYEVFRNTSDDLSGATVLPGVASGTSYDDIWAERGQMYYYWVKAWSFSGCSGYSTSDPGYRPLSPPTGLTASDGDYTDKVALSWDAVAGATYYKVFRNSSESHDGETELAPNNPTTTYDDTAATPGETYTYWVKACNSVGCSDYCTCETGSRDEGYAIFLPLINK